MSWPVPSKYRPSIEKNSWFKAWKEFQARDSYHEELKVIIDDARVNKGKLPSWDLVADNEKVDYTGMDQLKLFGDNVTTERNGRDYDKITLKDESKPTCKHCGNMMQQLFTSYYCQHDCDKKRNI